MASGAASTGVRHASRPRPAAGGNGRWLALLATAALVGGCAAPSGEELAAVEDRVDRLESAVETSVDTEELQDRLARLEDRVDAFTAAVDPAEVEDRADATEEQLAELAESVTVLDEELTTLAEELAGVEQELTTATSDLRSIVDGVRSGLDEVRADNDELRALIVTVRDRLDRCQADGSC